MRALKGVVVLELTTGLLIAAALALMVYCLVQTVEAPRSRVRLLPVGVWQVLLLLPFAGPLAWLVCGRPQPGHRIDVPGPGGQRRRPVPWEESGRRLHARHAGGRAMPGDWPAWPVTEVPQVVGPEDDPDFIAELARMVKRPRPDDDQP
jgi:hypothetical protein